MRVGDLRRKGAKFRAEVRWLPHAEGCAVLAEVLEREDIPEPIGALRVDHFLNAAKRSRVDYPAPDLAVCDLPDSDRAALAVELRGEKAAVVQR